jgi:predicted enzyme related to lactoylglutathione lyase
VTIDRMQIKQSIVVFDAADLDAESGFWAALLGGTVDADDDWHTVVVEGKPAIAVQLAPDHVAPDWPKSTTPQQIHLDLYVDDVRAAHDEAMALGAQVLEDRDLDTKSGYQVYADPAGHPFCLCW